MFSSKRRRDRVGGWLAFWWPAVLVALVVLCLTRAVPVCAADPSAAELMTEINKLREEVKEKVAVIEKKAGEAKEAADKGAKKAAKDRMNWGGELRLRIVTERAETSRGFRGTGQPSGDKVDNNATGFRTRLRLNFNAEVVPDLVDVYGRLTINKRWGQYSTWQSKDPNDSANSFHSSIGSDVSTRVEHAYGRFKIDYLNSYFYGGRLAAMDGPPSRQNAPFPRVFIDSEVDGAMWEWRIADKSLYKGCSPLASATEGTEKFPLGKGPLASYGKKLKESNSLIVAYAKYRDTGLTDPKGAGTNLGLLDHGPDTDVWIGQAQIKLAKDTELIFSGLYMPDLYMPRYSFDTLGTCKWSETYTDSSGNKVTIPYFTTYYSLYGAYLDTQLWKFQVYGAGYFCDFSIPAHGITYTDVSGTTTANKTFPGEKYRSGKAWWIGMNTGDAIAANQQFCVEYFRGKDNWIDPMNYRGFRRKGTVLEPANNYYYNPSSLSADTIVVGFYPANVAIWDIYYDYYVATSCRLRLGYMDFKYDAAEANSPLGASQYENYSWPYFEINMSW